jgi:hypothetical protein
LIRSGYHIAIKNRIYWHLNGGKQYAHPDHDHIGNYRGFIGYSLDDRTDQARHHGHYSRDHDYGSVHHLEEK